VQSNAKYFNPQGLRVCRDESFSHTGKKHTLSAFSTSRVNEVNGREIIKVSKGGFMTEQFSVSPDGTKYPLPTEEDYKREFERVKALVEDAKLQNKILTT